MDILQILQTSGQVQLSSGILRTRNNQSEDLQNDKKTKLLNSLDQHEAEGQNEV